MLWSIWVLLCLHCISICSVYQIHYMSICFLNNVEMYVDREHKALVVNVGKALLPPCRGTLEQYV